MERLQSSMQKHDTDDQIDPACAELVKQINAMLFSASPPEEHGASAARKLASNIFSAFEGPPEPEEIEIEDCLVDGSAGPIAARVYRKNTSSQRLRPLIIFFHGGGWSLGGLDDYDGLLRALAALSGVSFISIDYRLAPEHPFPAGLDDARAAVRHIVSHARQFTADASHIALMGDSAGGNLAAIIAHEAGNDRGVPIAAQFLLYPMLDVFQPHATYPSRMLFGNGDHFLTRDTLDASVIDYGLTPANCDNPCISPLSDADFSALPPTYLIVGGCDPLRDEASHYTERLQAAGVDVRCDIYAGAIHAFLSFGVLDCAQAGRKMLAREIKRRLQP